MTTPASAEPTEADWDTAQGCIERACQGNDWSEVIARALASQRAEIVARYEAVVAAATALDMTVSDYMLGWVRGDLVAKKQHAVRDAIREAAPK